MTEQLPDDLAALVIAADAAASRLAGVRLVVLVAAAPDPAATAPAAPSPLAAAGEPQAGVHQAARASLAGLGRPDLATDLPVPAATAGAIAAATGLPRRRGPLPVDLAVLALRLDPPRPVVPVAVDANTDGAALVALGQRIAEALADYDTPAALVAAGEGSAALSERAPRHHVDGADAWQEQYVAAWQDGDAQAIAALGPGEAARVHARGWAPATVTAAAAVGAGLEPSLCHHAAPRGVGYVVAAG